MKSFEINFDGIAGPTHHFGGLSYGNIASMQNKHQTSNPRKAALQCLEKMKFLHDLGILQGIIPPHERPHIPTLKLLGFTGSDDKIIEQSYKTNPEIFFHCSSSSAMWTANSSTVTPSTDNLDKLVKITPANLESEFHRSIESEFSSLILKKIFSDPDHFQHFPSLPSTSLFSDEGAANHTRFCNEYHELGVHLFVYGKSRFINSSINSKIFPARQTLEASQAIARQHQLNPDNVIYAQQNPKAIDQGVFHNDVASVGNCNLFFYHEEAFVDTDLIIERIQQKISLKLIKVSSKEISLAEAVNTYLFNSQLISNSEGLMSLIAPKECQDNKKVFHFIQKILCETNLISKAYFIDLKESMLNGGGPACLRLRVVLNEKELKALNQSFLFNEVLYLKLKAWIEKNYRDTLSFHDLADPSLFLECKVALNELTQILNLGSIYSFQK